MIAKISRSFDIWRWMDAFFDNGWSNEYSLALCVRTMPIDQCNLYEANWPALFFRHARNHFWWVRFDEIVDCNLFLFDYSGGGFSPQSRSIKWAQTERIQLTNAKKASKFQNSISSSTILWWTMRAGMVSDGNNNDGPDKWTKKILLLAFRVNFWTQLATSDERRIPVT